MKREAPTEREITDLIASAHEGLATPDPRRLAAIEQRLLEQPRLRGRKKIVWWWLAGALVAGAASALWWAVNYDSGQGQKQSAPAASSPAVTPPVAEQSARPGRNEAVESKPTSESGSDRSPLIFKRER